MRKLLPLLLITGAIASADLLSTGLLSASLRSAGLRSGPDWLQRSAQAQTSRRASRKVKFVPPPIRFNRGAPGNRGHNASRDPNCLALNAPNPASASPASGLASGPTSDSALTRPALTTLVPTYPDSQAGPEYVASRTASAQPVLWVYVPVDETAAQTRLELILENDTGEEIYQTEIEPPQASGLLAIAPPDWPELEPGSYRWLLLSQVFCTPDGVPVEDYDDGLLEYLPIEDDSLLNSVTTDETIDTALGQVQVAATAGYWHEAFDQTARLKQRFPDHEAVEEAWRSLLNEIGLEAFADAPFAPTAAESNDIQPDPDPPCEASDTTSL